MNEWRCRICFSPPAGEPRDGCGWLADKGFDLRQAAVPAWLHISNGPRHAPYVPVRITKTSAALSFYRDRKDSRRELVTVRAVIEYERDPS